MRENRKERLYSNRRFQAGNGLERIWTRETLAQCINRAKYACQDLYLMLARSFIFAMGFDRAAVQGFVPVGGEDNPKQLRPVLWL